MAILELTFRAESLDFDQNVMVILPEPENLGLAKKATLLTVLFQYYICSMVIPMTIALGFVEAVLNDT